MLTLQSYVNVSDNKQVKSNVDRKI